MNPRPGDSPADARTGREAGVALPLAILLLIALGLVATSAVFLSNTESRISSRYSFSNTALAAAEAAFEHGVSELTRVSRIPGVMPDTVTTSGSLGRFSYTVKAFSKFEEGRDFNGNHATNDEVLYDRSFGYERASATGGPGDRGHAVKVVVATATDAHGSSAQVRAEVTKNRLEANLDSPLVLNSPANAVLTGSFDVDGRLYDRRGNLVGPESLDNPSYGNTAESKAAAKTACNYYKAAIKIPAEGVLALAGAMNSRGHVAFDNPLNGDNFDWEDSLRTFKFTPEDVLGVPSDFFDDLKKTADEVSDYRNLQGVNYIVSGDVSSQISGSGILIVHNPRYDPRRYDCLHFPTQCVPGYVLDPANQPMTLRINAAGSFNGIIITDNLIRLNGNFEMLGGIVSLATEDVNIPANGNGWVKWSCETVRDAVEQANSYNVRLSWEHSSL